MSYRVNEMAKVEIEIIVNQIRHLNEGIKKLEERFLEEGLKKDGFENITSIK